MDRDVPPRVTYWTGIWRPGLEAISNEVDTLRRALAPAAPIVSFSNGQRTSFVPNDGVIRLSSSRRWLLRALAAAIERTGDVTHAWGSVGDWHFPGALGRRPFVFTAVLPGTTLPVERYARVSRFVAESEPLAGQLRDAGVPADRVSIVYPGVDLDAFTPAPPLDGRSRVLFASSPSRVSEFEARGIPLLVEIARACPDIDVVLLWREWGDADAASARLAELRPPSNLHRESRGARTMADVFRSAHIVACLFGDGFGKSCPNSVIEGLACGRPALVSEHCGIADLVMHANAGFAVPRTIEAAVDGIGRLQSSWSVCGNAARTLAESHFDVRRYVQAYREIYRTLSR